MELRRDGAAARLVLDDAPVTAVVRVEDEGDADLDGTALEFDDSGRLVGLTFEDAERRLPSGLLSGDHSAWGEWDRGSGAAFLYLAGPSRAVVDATVVFGGDLTRPAWGINIDLDRTGRVFGIEFEMDSMAPRALLDGFVRLS